MNRWRLTQALLVVIVLIPVIPGCKPDPVVDSLERLKEAAKAKGHTDVAKRCEMCLSRWRNRTLDPEPILITALLGRVTGSRMYLWLDWFDEGKDVIGFGITEDYTDVNGLKTVLTEEYPAFVHRMLPSVRPLCFCPVQTRDVDQRKDAQRWDQYVKGEGIHATRPLSDVRWRETLPPVLVSIPEPNRVDVYVHVYDQTGCKSNLLKLLPPLREGDYTPTPEQLFWRKVRTDRERSKQGPTDQGPTH